MLFFSKLGTLLGSLVFKKKEFVYYFLRLKRF